MKQELKIEAKQNFERGEKFNTEKRHTIIKTRNSLFKINIEITNLIINDEKMKITQFK